MTLLLPRRKFLTGVGASLLLPQAACAGNIINPHTFPSGLFAILNTLGLTTGLKVCLDAGDVASYSSGQKWLDTSGNGYDFFIGDNADVNSFDPTFNGTPGGLSSAEYFALAGDFFRYDGANEAWMNNFHKDGAKFTLFMWVNLPAIDNGNGLLGNTFGLASGQHGFVIRFNTGNPRLMTFNNSSPSTVTSTLENVAGWNFVAVSIDEAAASALFQLNAAQESFSHSYSSPSSTNAAQIFEIGSMGGTVNALTGNIGMVGIYEGGSLTLAQIDSVYQKTRGRFGV